MGYNPVYPNTTTRFPNYNPDNFIMVTDRYGHTTFFNYDDAAVYSDATIRTVSGYSNRRYFLASFDWVYNSE
jgi:hypothetical protein